MKDTCHISNLANSIDVACSKVLPRSCGDLSCRAPYGGLAPYITEMSNNHWKSMFGASHSDEICSSSCSDLSQAFHVFAKAGVGEVDGKLVVSARTGVFVCDLIPGHDGLHGSIIRWHYRIMVTRYQGTMVARYHGSRVRVTFYSNTMLPQYHGTMAAWDVEWWNFAALEQDACFDIGFSQLKHIFTDARI